jgi:Ca-activated chloride channel family protein
VSFGAPLVLLALLALPVLAVLYARREQGRRAAEDAFASPTLAASVAPRRPGLRRHVGPLVLALALATLVIAAARPQTTIAVPVERASIMLVTDVSGSMLATDVAPDRLTAARRAAQRFVAQVPKEVNVGVIAFNQVPTILQRPTQDRNLVNDALLSLRASGGTATGEAINAALKVIDQQGTVNGRRPPAAIVLLSDGVSVRGMDPVAAAREAARKKIPITTVALGTDEGTIQVPRAGGQGGFETRPVPPDPESLAEIARVSGGKAFTAVDSAELSQVYERLGSQLGREERPREISTAFAGGALVLLLLGALSSLRWFGRIV